MGSVFDAFRGTSVKIDIFKIDLFILIRISLRKRAMICSENQEWRALR